MHDVEQRAVWSLVHETDGQLSLRATERPMLIFGAPIMNSGLTLDIESRALVRALQPGNVRYIEPAALTHFDFLNLCKPEGYEILAEEIPGDEVVCEDGDAHRAAMHDLILDEVTAFYAHDADMLKNNQTAIPSRALPSGSIR